MTDPFQRARTFHARTRVGYTEDQRSPSERGVDRHELFFEVQRICVELGTPFGHYAIPKERELVAQFLFLEVPTRPLVSVLVFFAQLFFLDPQQLLLPYASLSRDVVIPTKEGTG